MAYDASFASLYDVFYRDKPYEAEATFVGRLFREQGVQPPARLLDVACGTGQHAVRFADAGWTVVGVDRSEAMLASARARAAGRAVEFLQQDMAALDLVGEPFDAAVCLFDSIGYALTNERIHSTLTGIRRQLRDGGLFMVEFWHAAAMLTSYDPQRERTWPLEDGSVTRMSETSLDVSRQVARVAYRIEHRDAGGDATDESQEIHENRFFLVQEMGHFLSMAGFDVLGWLAGFANDGNIDSSTWHVLGLARAQASRS
jgi:ubiquinone/menaquinone biosynthesis C-methylase UbiE